MFRTTRAWVILLVVGLLVASCARSPEAQKARHLERGDKYVAREQGGAAAAEEFVRLAQSSTRLRVRHKPGTPGQALLAFGRAASADHLAGPEALGEDPRGEDVDVVLGAPGRGSPNLPKN
jgi:hypothetical protein